MSKKNIILAAVSGLGIYILHLVLVWILGPIIGMNKSGFLYLVFKTEIYTLGLILFLVEEATHNIFGCTTTPCMFFNLLIALFVYPFFGILSYLSYSRIKKLITFKKS